MSEKFPKFPRAYPPEIEALIKHTADTTSTPSSPYEEGAPWRVQELINLVQEFSNDPDMPPHLSKKMQEAAARHGYLVEDVRAMVGAMQKEKLDASHDQLTGIFNRRKFQSELEAHLAHGNKRAGKSFVVLMDMDKFKAVNDTYGHSIGDILLVDIATNLRTAFRGGDVLARIGGDEFAALVSLPNSMSEEEATAEMHHIVERIQAAAYETRCMLRDKLAVMEGLSNNAPLVVQEGEKCLSVGFAEIQQGDTAASILAEADKKMYLAKQEGRETPSDVV